MFVCRVMVVLDDNYLYAISPLSGETLHFTYPFRTVVARMRQVQLSLDGKYYNTLLENGALIGIDCSKNPAEITFKHSTKTGFTVNFYFLQQYKF